MNRPLIALAAACVVLVATTSCALLPVIGAAPDARTPVQEGPPSSGVPELAKPIDGQPAARAPGVIGFDATENLAGFHRLGFSATLTVEPHVVPRAADGDPTDITFDYAEFGCELLLRQATARQAGLVFSTDDVVSTALVLTAYFGDITEASIVPVALRLHDGAGSLEAVAVILTDDEGRQVLAIARAVGALGQAIYMDFRCAPGVPSETIFATEIAPYISVVLE